LASPSSKKGKRRPVSNLRPHAPKEGKKKKKKKTTGKKRRERGGFFGIFEPRG